jgi:microcystin-dependent protein
MSLNISVPEELIQDVSDQKLYINGGLKIHIDNTDVLEIEQNSNINVRRNININSSNTNSYIFKGIGMAPIGMIAMWSGDENGPGGCWALCDGDNETPDLRGKFIMSSTYSSTLTINGESTNYSLGQTDGKQYVTLEDEEMPSHSHHGDTQDSQHSHIIELGDYDDGNFTGNPGQFPPADAGTSKFTGGNWKTDSGGAHTHSYTTDSSGGDLAHENRPSYYVLAFIMRIF